MRSAQSTIRQRIVPWVLCLAAVGLIAGCRAGRGSERAVRVTETAPTVTPRQATTSLASDTSATKTKTVSTDRATRERKRGILAGGKMPGQPNPGTKLSLSDQTPPSPSETREDRIAKAQALLNPEKKTVTTKKETVGELVSASLNDLNDSMSIEPKTAPTSSGKVEVQQRASGNKAELSPLVASKRRTQSPRGIDDLLKKSLNELPELSQSAMVPSGLSTTRIGQSKNVTSKTAQSTSSVGDMVARSEKTRATLDEAMPQAVNASVVPVSHDARNSATPQTAHAIEPVPVPAVRGSASDMAITQASTTEKPGPEAVAELSEADLFNQLLARVQTPVSGESPTDRERRMIVARHLMVLAGNPVSATESVDGMNETDQQYLKHQLLGLWTMIDPQGHPSSGRRITEALPRFREATRYLSEATDSLQLKNIEFCTEIEAYGQVQPFEGNRFDAGQQVILYCEVENFIAEEMDGALQTRLRGTYDVYDASGTKVVSQLLPVDEQTSRNHLRDYFLAYQMNLPEQLESGSYRMQLTIEDVVGKKYGQAEIPFEIK